MWERLEWSRSVSQISSPDSPGRTLKRNGSVRTRTTMTMVMMKSAALTQQVVVRIPLVLEGEPAVAHVVQVLQPLKVRDGDAPRVQVHVLGTTPQLRPEPEQNQNQKPEQNQKPPLTGITRMSLSRKIRSASGVVGPLAPSAMICQNQRETGSEPEKPGTIFVRETFVSDPEEQLISSVRRVYQNSNRTSSEPLTNQNQARSKASRSF